MFKYSPRQSRCPRDPADPRCRRYRSTSPSCSVFCCYVVRRERVKCLAGWGDTTWSWRRPMLQFTRRSLFAKLISNFSFCKDKLFNWESKTNLSWILFWGIFISCRSELIFVFSYKTFVTLWHWIELSLGVFLRLRITLF